MNHVQRSSEAYGRSADRYVEAIGTTVSGEFEVASDLVVLHEFAGLVVSSGGRALDAGCGPGRIARLLADRGVDVIGVDVAPGMIDAARHAHSHIPFCVGELGRLPIAESALAAVASWYSIITTPPPDLAATFEEFARVLGGGGLALIAFQSGDGEAVVRTNAYGTGVDLTLFRHDEEHIAAQLRAASFEVIDVSTRDPMLVHEEAPQTTILARV